MKLTFLGTGCMQPTKERNLSATLLSYESENILFDCGEGTQRQMRIMGLKPTKITRIIISHFHGDHIFGLAGLLRNLEASGYNKTLYIYGPKNIKKYFNNIINSAAQKTNLKVKLVEIKSGIIVDEPKFQIEAQSLDHSIESFGFSFIEKPKRKINLQYVSKLGLTKHPILGKLQKGQDITWKGKKITVKKGTKLVEGKKFTIICDTTYCKNCVKLAKNSDILVCESSFSKKEKDKAKEYKHLTAEEAGKIAKTAKVKKLILTHFSQRYKNTNDLKKEAQKLHKNVTCASDFLEIKI